MGNTGDIPIQQYEGINLANISPTNPLLANEVYSFTYNGSAWVAKKLGGGGSITEIQLEGSAINVGTPKGPIVNIKKATENLFGVVKLGQEKDPDVNKDTTNMLPVADSGSNYPVQTDNNDRMFVKVPAGGNLYMHEASRDGSNPPGLPGPYPGGASWSFGSDIELAKVAFTGNVDHLFQIYNGGSNGNIAIPPVLGFTSSSGNAFTGIEKSGNSYNFVRGKTFIETTGTQTVGGTWNIQPGSPLIITGPNGGGILVPDQPLP